MEEHGQEWSVDGNSWEALPKMTAKEKARLELAARLIETDLTGFVVGVRTRHRVG